jgi:Zn-dependent protease
MFKNIKLFKFQGIPVTLDPLFFILFFFLDISYVVILFISVLIHEMAHSLAATSRGWRTFGINIGLLFGTAEIELENIPERDSIPIILAGPLSNFILTSISFALYSFIPESLQIYALEFMIINAVLFIFNILPIYPLDGGRVVRDYLNIKLRDRSKSKKISATISLVFSIALLVYSLISFNWFMAVFTLLFVYMAVKDLNIIK